MRERFLLGATKDNELVFGEFEITTRNGYPEFTASFDTVRPFNGDNINLKDYFWDYLDGIDVQSKYQLCENFDCSPRELPEQLANECEDPRGAMDCSLYPEEFEIGGNHWYFESGTCGQYDSRKDMKIYVNKEAYDLLHEIWDKYHLKNISGKQEVMYKINRITKLLKEVDEEKWITDYIQENF